MTQTQTEFPRTQHWNVDGFRVSILLYKTHRNQRCYVCGDRGAIHWVSAERKSDDMSGMADFCSTCRPAKGTLPPLVYVRYYRSDPFWTCESLNPHPGWTCGMCGQPARFHDRLMCDECDDPEFQVSYQNTVIPFRGPERVESGVRHEQHTVMETFECDSCRLPAAG